MNESQKAYNAYVKKRMKKSPILRNTCFAFLIGGGICAASELLYHLYRTVGASPSDAGTWVSITLIFLAALLTGFGLFDDIARVAGAGTLLPVTGFANAVVSPAIDTKSEGPVLGVGAKIFTVAGPVILYAILAGAVYGVIYYTVGLFF